MKEIIESAGGMLQGNLASVPIGENFQNVDSVVNALQKAGWHVLCGQVNSTTREQILKIEKR